MAEYDERKPDIQVNLVAMRNADMSGTLRGDFRARRRGVEIPVWVGGFDYGRASVSQQKRKVWDGAKAYAN